MSDIFYYSFPVRFLTNLTNGQSGYILKAVKRGNPTASARLGDWPPFLWPFLKLPKKITIMLPEKIRSGRRSQTKVTWLLAMSDIFYFSFSVRFLTNLTNGQSGYILKAVKRGNPTDIARLGDWPPFLWPFLSFLSK
jgi:hypothetical protein